MVQQVGIRQGLLMRSYYTGAVTQVRPAGACALGWRVARPTRPLRRSVCLQERV